MPEAGVHCGPLSEVGSAEESGEIEALLGEEALDDSRGVIGAAVVHEDELTADRSSGDVVGQPLCGREKPVLLVVERHDQGDRCALGSSVMHRPQAGGVRRNDSEAARHSEGVTMRCQRPLWVSMKIVRPYARPELARGVLGAPAGDDGLRLGGECRAGVGNEARDRAVVPQEPRAAVHVPRVPKDEDPELLLHRLARP